MGKALDIAKFLVFCILLPATVFAQKQTPEISYPAIGSKLPSFEILLLDGQTIVNTGTINNSRPTIFLLFSPDCSHCAELSLGLTQSISSFDSVNLCLLSAPLPIIAIKQFAARNKLLDFEQITVGQDMAFFFANYFHTKTVPFAAIYDKNKKLVKILKEIKSVDELLSELKTIK